MSEELKSCPFCRAKINTERTFPVWECGNSMPICGEPEYLRSYRCMERQISMLESSTEVLVVNNESMMKRSENYMESKDRLQEAKDDLLSTRLHIREICKQLGIPYSGKDSLVDVEAEIGQLLHDKAELEGRLAAVKRWRKEWLPEFCTSGGVLNRILSDTRPALAVVEGLVHAEKFSNNSAFYDDRVAIWRSSDCDHPEYKPVTVIVLQGGDR